MYEIINVTGRHPYWIQFLCRRLFEETGSLRAISSQDLVVEPIQLDYFWMDFNSLSYQEQAILLALVQSPLTTAGQLYKVLEKEGISNANFHSVLLGLEQLGFIRTTGQEYLIGNNFLQTWLEDTSLQPTAPPEISEADPHAQRVKLINFIKKIFIALPSFIGRFLLDLLGREDAAKSSTILTGYFVIFLVLSLLLRIVDPNTLRDIFTNMWDFISPP